MVSTNKNLLTTMLDLVYQCPQVTPRDGQPEKVPTALLTLTIQHDRQHRWPRLAQDAWQLVMQTAGLNDCVHVLVILLPA